MAQPQISERDNIRVPLIGTIFSRIISTASGTSSASGIVGVGVVGVMIVGATVATAKDQRFVNAIPEKIVNPLTQAENFFVSKRPGFAALNTPAAANIGTAVHVWAGQTLGTKVISAFGATNSTIYDAVSSLGSTTGKVNFISDTLIGTTANLLMTTTSNTAYYYPEGGAITLINDVDFAGNVAGEVITGNFASLNGYNFIMTVKGNVYNSDLNSISAWTANSFIAANMTPDTGVGLTRYKDQIMAFGSESIEFFQIVDNQDGSPLKSTSQGFIKIGCINQYSYGNFDDTVTWLGSSAESGLGLYMLNGFQAVRKSTPWIEAILSTTSISGLSVNCIKLVGKSFVVITSTSDNRTYVYCIEDDMWHEWTSTTILWQHMAGIAAGVKYIYAVTEQGTSGKVYVINPTSFTFQDDSTNYTMTIQTSKIDGGNSRRKFLSKVRLVGDVQTSTCTVGVAWSDDDYVTNSTPRDVDMSTTDPKLSACGSFRRRAFILTNTGNIPCRLEALELEIGQGIH